jgi:pimeloyl-ACP methyl ester carboxylesterase
LQEQYLNSFNHCTMEANGIQMHFVHERSPHPDAIPLLLLHGWPGSFFEFHKIAKRLAYPGEPHSSFTGVSTSPAQARASESNL